MAQKQNRWIEERDTYWNSIQIVHPGEVFPLLHLEKNGATTRTDDNGSFAGIASRIRLQTSLFDTLNISIAAAPYALQRGAVVAPFERHKGYPVDQEDFSLHCRMKKIAHSKNELAEIVEGLGLVIFAGESFTMCPLTTDHAVLKSQLYNVQSGLLEDGTAIGSGLATGVERLRSSVSKSKVIILLTDGEDNGGRLDPNTAKEIAKSFGVRVYTVGVGTEGFAPVPVQTSNGVIMQKEKVSIDEKLLTQIANETGGKYFRATDNESLGSIYKEIDRLEKSKYEVTTFTHYTEKFLPFVLSAIMFLVLEWILRFTLFRKFP